jgi:hypothetical protein
MRELLRSDGKLPEVDGILGWKTIQNRNELQPHAQMVNFTNVRLPGNFVSDRLDGRTVHGQSENHQSREYDHTPECRLQFINRWSPHTKQRIKYV